MPFPGLRTRRRNGRLVSAQQKGLGNG